MAVPFFTGARSFEARWPRIEELLDEALDSGTFITGPIVQRLERALAEYTGARHALAVASGSDAVQIALEVCGVGPGDEVIVPCYTFFASASTVVHAGAVPVFADIDADTYGIDVDSAADRVTSSTRAIMPVHLFTQMADVRGVAALAAERGLSIVEDSAEGIGMSLDGVSAGLFGRAGVLSFFPTKTLGAVGDGGMVLTDDDELADAVRRLRHHGQVPDERAYVWDRLGLNSRLDDVQASVLLARLETLEEDIRRRAELARAYDARLGPLADRVTTPRLTDDPAARTVFYVYLIEADERDGLVEHLAARGIETEVYYPRPLHLQPCFASLGYGEGDFPVAERAATRALALPLYPDLSESAVDEVCTAIEGFYAGRAGGASRPTAGGARK